MRSHSTEDGEAGKKKVDLSETVCEYGTEDCTVTEFRVN
jgi:hypothetical protein